MPESKELEKIQADFNRAAKKYDEHAMLQRKVAEDLMRFINKILVADTKSNPKRILDVGCGTGYLHELIRKAKYKNSLMQVDLAFDMCQIAHDYRSLDSYGKTDTVNADMHYLPFKDNSFEIVMSSMSLQWSSSLGLVFKDIEKILTESGVLLFAMVAEGSLWQLKTAYEKLFQQSSTEDVKVPVYKFHNQQQLEILLTESGFSNIELVTKTIDCQFDDIYKLLASIKNIGGRYKKFAPQGKNSGLGRKNIKLLGESYQQLFANNPSGMAPGLPLSWNIIYGVCS